MCSRVAVMTQGKIIEELSAVDLRNQSAKTEYTRQLIQASRGKATA
jgi:ABC-type dipeptide/oligopeptide/nickel transport system ATPase subunit